MTTRRILKLLPAIFCFLLALGFRFLLIGYGIMALLFAGIGVCIILYIYLPRKWKIALSCLLLAGVLILIVVEIPVIKASKGHPETEADYLIVLGAGVNGTVPSLSMLNRLTAAKAYLDAHPDCVAIVSGGQGPGEDITEATAMFRWLTSQGIAPERIMMEENSTSTAENLEFSIAMIPDAHHMAIAVCSSEYHLYRAEYIARQMGYELSGVPGRTSYLILRLNYFIREGLGVIYLHIFG